MLQSVQQKEDLPPLYILSFISHIVFCKIKSRTKETGHHKIHGKQCHYHKHPIFVHKKAFSGLLQKKFYFLSVFLQLFLYR